MLNMVLKDMSNKTGYKVVPTSQIKYNRRRRKRREGKKTYTGTCTDTQKHTHAHTRLEASAESRGRLFKSHERPVRA